MAMCEGEQRENMSARLLRVSAGSAVGSSAGEHTSDKTSATIAQAVGKNSISDSFLISWISIDQTLTPSSRCGVFIPRHGWAGTFTRLVG